ncbi:unnamed protein product [Oikopleura dioica]|uniref:Uncharacterized protein n=1 Tax=Oikopleura dioica TaxID=34765 RepID=E4XTC2_OIKDI|nr:unnamed protein product [Oikopleura dioica]
MEDLNEAKGSPKTCHKLSFARKSKKSLHSRANSSPTRRRSPQLSTRRRKQVTKPSCPVKEKLDDENANVDCDVEDEEQVDETMLSKPVHDSLKICFTKNRPDNNKDVSVHSTLKMIDQEGKNILTSLQKLSFARKGKKSLHSRTKLPLTRRRSPQPSTRRRNHVIASVGTKYPVKENLADKIATQTANAHADETEPAAENASNDNKLQEKPSMAKRSCGKLPKKTTLPKIKAELQHK